MYSYYWSDGQYIVINDDDGTIIDSFIDLDMLLEEYPEALEK